MEAYMMWVWLGAMLFFGAVEALTAGLVSIWFVAGALAALLVQMLGTPVFFQVAVFVVVSAVTLVLTRPLVKKFQNGTIVPTNADRLTGQLVKVTEQIDNENSAGAVYADGKTWTARSTDGRVCPAGTQVRVAGLEGVKLLVEDPDSAEIDRAEEA